MVEGQAPGSTLLLQFARRPVPGRVKTRLMPPLSSREACAVHERLVRHCMAGLLSSSLGPVELWVDDQPDHPLFRQCLDQGAAGVRRQRGSDLGQRMYHALRWGLRRARKVILVGSDCPFIDASYLRRAERSLERHAIVLGPALDGGYVLFGCREAPPSALFRDMPWGGSQVLALTRERADRADLAVALLPALRDIDRPEDLAYWERFEAGRVDPPAAERDGEGGWPG